MNQGTVIIVKMKWEEDSHYSKVKRVYFDEQKALDFIDQEKLKEENLGAFWILSDREISDFTPCMSDKDIELIKVEAQQSIVETMIHDNNKGMDPYLLELYWSQLEQLRIKLDE